MRLLRTIKYYSPDRIHCPFQLPIKNSLNIHIQHILWQVIRKLVFIYIPFLNREANPDQQQA
jgi:hypothetical protein